ncbi:MAG: GNAT family N-acetyltransferase [Oceanospirillaceae bacterium]|nr:GNAT family N-acetyltransferase [Oceanospirillaceae bacterium]
MIREIEDRDVAFLFPVRIATRENRLSMDELAGIGITEVSIREAIKGSHKGWLYEQDGNIVGFAMGDSDANELTVIALLPQYEKMGIGRKLLGKVEKWLKAQGCKSIWLTTDINDQLQAYTFYINNGWQDLKIEQGLRYMSKELI